MESPPTAAAVETPEGPASRFARRLGLALLVLATFLPYHGCIAHPSEYEPRATTVRSYGETNEAYVPAARCEYFVRRHLAGEAEEGLENRLLLGTNGASNDYGFLVFLGLPPWLLLLRIARRKGGRDRRSVGVLLWLLSLALPPTVAFALADRTPGSPGLPPAIAVSIGAGTALFLAWRPPGRRRPEDIEATLSTHALVAIGVVLCRPTLDYMGWVFQDGYSLSAIALAMVHNYRPGFFVTLTALSLAAAPLYFSEESLRGLYDRCRPWRPPSSTPTPTSTSTGSTPTGTPSSAAPAGPGSSPS